MKIKVVTVGKLKEKYLKDGIAEYSKRISRFAKFEMIELSDEKTPDKASESENQKILEIEGQRILSKIADRDFVIVLAIEGKTFFSEEFSKQLEETSIKGFSTLTFIIGGSLGLSSSVKNRANLSV
ncbi:TPA: 23S rRNA (pseudouridine(1915)-N(3))-methyltransferase RlmH, partial [Streptococcus pneumoniae]|nr:23S rRNA (pseudouridine(1915)-N(3))-methyltransferase RlmH [Streptococcus pneumoniae]